MKIYQEVQKSFVWIGFDQKLEPFNRKISSILAITFTAVLLQWIFLIHVAETAQQYMESMYIVSTCSGIFLAFASSTFTTKRLFSFIKRVNESVDESK